MDPSPHTSNTPKSNFTTSSINPLKAFPPLQVDLEILPKFIYTLVHEIRNPLTNISLATEVLKQLPMDDVQKMYLNIILRNSERVNNLVAALLNSGEANEMKPEKHCIHYLLEEVLIMNEDRFMLKKVAVRKNYTNQEFKMQINRSQVKMALANIIINAIEAMPASNGLLEISTKVLQGVCIIVIKDNGIGISKDNLTNIFKPHFTNKPGGMGMGLSDTLAVLNSNHIKINLRSELGKGTSFILSHKKDLL